MFTEYPTYDRYRTLKRTTVPMRGEDVYALQTGLTAVGQDTNGVDGIFGDGTLAAVKAFQASVGLVVDGLAGGDTQTALTRRFTNKVRAQHDLPKGLIFGQCMHESGCRVGNYSPPHSWGTTGANFVVDGVTCAADLGVAQRNSRFYDVEESFNMVKAIDSLGLNVKQYYDLFAGVPTTRRRWELASGSWNAPAWACWIAKQEGATQVRGSQTAKPTDAQRARLEGYMASATAYMEL